MPDEIGAGGLGFLRLVTTGDHEHAHRLAGAGGQHDRATHDLIGVPRIDAEAHRDFDRLVELGERRRLHDFQRRSRCIRPAMVAIFAAAALNFLP